MIFYLIGFATLIVTLIVWSFGKVKDGDFEKLPGLTNNLAIFVFLIFGALVSSDGNKLRGVDGLISASATVTFCKLVTVYFLVFQTTQCLKLKPIFRSIKRREKRVSFRISLILLSISYLPFLIENGADLNSWYAWGRRGGGTAFMSAQNSVVSLLTVILSYTILPSLIFIFGRGVSRMKGYRRMIILTLSINLLVLFSLSGSRTGVASLLIVLLMDRYFSHKKRWAKNAIFAGILLVLGLAITFFQVSRRYGDRYESQARSGLAGSNLNLELATICDLYPDKYPHVYYNGPVIVGLPVSIGYTCFQWLVNPIPRIVWTSKPFDRGFTEYNFVRTGIDGTEGGTNITPTVVGRYYLKYGLGGVSGVAIIMGVLYKWISVSIARDTKKKIRPNIVLLFFLALLFLSFRDFTPGRFYPLGFLYLLHKKL